MYRVYSVLGTVPAAGGSVVNRNQKHIIPVPMEPHCI